jgi:hypothetical protein
MSDAVRVVGIVGCAAGGVEQLREALVEPLIERGRPVAVTLTPTAARWLDAVGKIERLAAVTGLPVRSEPRLPGEGRPHPPVDVFVIAPASASSVAKLALGIGDNQALAPVCEALGSVPIIVFPRVNAAHARHPAWPGHLDALRQAGVELIYGEDVWPLHEPRSAPGKQLPWSAVIDAVDRALKPDG